ncbi:MAG: outer membrane protein assembly factor BamE [Paracoccaceae bacterium]|nr:outer membrane protein assembly factor BamE [Paracoccaceae bacterium]
MRQGRRASGPLAVAVAASLALAGCSPIVRNHGYVPPDEDLAEISVGLDTRETVEDTLGSPGASGVIDQRGFYYVSQRVQQRGYRDPEVIDREIVAISFDEQGVVTNVERFGLEDGNVVALSRRVTDSSVQGIGFLRQLLGNLGRINLDGLGGG